MTPQTPIIDRNFKGVGRIKRATGTTSPKMREALNRMLTTLRNDGRLDILRAIRDGKLSMLEVYDSHRRNALNSLPLAETLAELAEQMETWISTADVSEKTRYTYRQSLKYIQAEKSDAKVSDIPAVLETLRNTLGVKHARSFNLTRSSVSAFVRSTLKRNHPLWAAINAVEKRKEKGKRKGKPLAVAQMRGFFPSPETDPVDAIAWAMATTGMHQEELWGRWHVEDDRIHVEGTKRTGRVRDVPFARRPSVPTIHRRTFEDKLRERTRAFQVYDLRRTFAHWMELAGIPRTRRQMYLGHGAKDVTDLYERHEVIAFLKGDAAKLRKLLKLPHTKAHTMKRGLRAI